MGYNLQNVICDPINKIIRENENQIFYFLQPSFLFPLKINDLDCDCVLHDDCDDHVISSKSFLSFDRLECQQSETLYLQAIEQSLSLALDLIDYNAPPLEENDEFR